MKFKQFYMNESQQIRYIYVSSSDEDYYSDDDEMKSDYLEQADTLIKSSGLRMLRDDDMECVAVAESNKVVGVLYYSFDDNSIHWSICVDEVYRNRGIAKELYSRVQSISEYEFAESLVAELIPPYTLEQFVKSNGYELIDTSNGFRVYQKNLMSDITEATDIEYFEVLDDSSIKILVPVERWPITKLSKINTLMKRKGYDIRGVEDVIMLINRRMTTSDNILSNSDWAGSIISAFPPKVEKSLAQTIRSKVARYFGLTNDFSIAGYITPDGKLLDFSGRRQGSWGKTREVDHREINAALEDLDHSVSQGGTAGMNEFMKFGYIRIDFKAGMIDAETEPTQTQYSVLRKFLSTCKSDNIQVSLNGKGKSFYDSIDMQGNGARKVYNIIQGYYSGNINQSLVSKFHESKKVRKGANE